MVVVRWTHWNDNTILCSNAISLSNKEYIDPLIKEIRRNNYHFSGTYHQNGEFGIPVFSDGKALYLTMREWGELMHMAYPKEAESYLDYYTDDEDKEYIFPTESEVKPLWKDNDKCKNYDEVKRLCAYRLIRNTKRKLDASSLRSLYCPCDQINCPISNPELLR